MILLRINIFTFFWIMQIVAFFIYLRNGKVPISSDICINLIFLELLISVLFGLLGNMWISYKKAAIISLVIIVPIYFTYAYINNASKRNEYLLDVIKKGIKYTCTIELCWCLLQFVLFRFARIDINKIIFQQMILLYGMKQVKN